MEYLQYYGLYVATTKKGLSFKPYYKWNTFNTETMDISTYISDRGFKPYYKWNTFNT